MDKERADALTLYDQLLEDLSKYLKQLGEEESPSAVGLEELKEIRDLLRKNSHEAAQKKARDLLDNLKRTEFMQITGDCVRTTQRLLIAFRD